MEPEIKIIKPDELDQLLDLISVFEDVFEMKPFKRPNETYLKGLLNQDHFFAVVARTDSKIIGGLTVYVLDQYYAEKPLAYIYDLAVLTEYQRKGVGRKLIEFTNEYCRGLGFQEAFVQADKVDDYALEFYRSTNPTAEEQVVHYSYMLH
jgi:aminoglycoside 3-N-acetyltransferase I